MLSTGAAVTLLSLASAMNHCKRLFSVLALFSYLLAGGWGPGSYWVRCEGSDGRVEIQSRFDLCCSTSDDDLDGTTEMVSDTEVAVLNGPDSCSLCVETPLLSELARGVQDRTSPSLTPDESVVAAIIVPPVSSSALHLLQRDPLLTHLGGAAHISVATVVLRC